MKELSLILSLFTSIAVLAQDKQFAESIISPNYATIELDTSQFWGFEFRDHQKTDLTSQELILLDSIVDVCIYESNNGLSEFFVPMEIGNYNFIKQFVPTINGKGEKIIWVNCLCYNDVIELKKDSKKEKRKNKKMGIESKVEIVAIDYGWMNEIYIVDDGGNCYFNFKINLDTLSYFDIYVNGY